MEVGVFLLKGACLLEIGGDAAIVVGEDEDALAPVVDHDFDFGLVGVDLGEELADGGGVGGGELVDGGAGEGGLVGEH